jgi:hypothetical protein
LLQGLAAVLGLADDDEITLDLEQVSQAVPEDREVFVNKETERLSPLRSGQVTRE